MRFVKCLLYCLYINLKNIWRDGQVVLRHTLGSACTAKGIVGSNLTLSSSKTIYKIFFKIFFVIFSTITSLLSLSAL